MKDHVSIDAEDERARQLVAALAERWPKCFAVAEQERRPLKPGIHRDLVAASVTIDDVDLALRSYTGSTHYKRRLTAGAARFDLDGCPAGRVSTREAASAVRSLAGHQQPKPRRLSLNDLRAAAQARKQAATDNEPTAPPKRR